AWPSRSPCAAPTPTARRAAPPSPGRSPLRATPATTTRGPPEPGEGERAGPGRTGPFPLTEVLPLPIPAVLSPAGTLPAGGATVPTASASGHDPAARIRR